MGIYAQAYLKRFGQKNCQYMLLGIWLNKVLMLDQISQAVHDSIAYWLLGAWTELAKCSLNWRHSKSQYTM